VNRCPITVVPVEEVERFAAEYVSLFALAKQQGRHFLAVKKELDAAGIEPALESSSSNAFMTSRLVVRFIKMGMYDPSDRRRRSFPRA
jgi:hypothetical protein